MIQLHPELYPSWAVFIWLGSTFGIPIYCHIWLTFLCCKVGWIFAFVNYGIKFLMMSSIWCMYTLHYHGIFYYKRHIFLTIWTVYFVKWSSVKTLIIFIVSFDYFLFYCFLCDRIISLGLWFHHVHYCIKQVN